MTQEADVPAPDEAPPEVPARTTMTLVLAGPIERATIPDLCARLGRMLAEGGDQGADDRQAVVCDVGGVAATAVVLDALARLQLTARRAGCSLQLRGVGDDLRGLLTLTGLGEVLGLGDSAGSAGFGDDDGAGGDGEG
jgi:ABC-type transporter Mla MlaB component